MDGMGYSEKYKPLQDQAAKTYSRFVCRFHRSDKNGTLPVTAGVLKVRTWDI